ncbi:MAG: hypothetical protein JST80_12295 [Bdellovibrionales bacterium]|nr:hypothetical protein [Bdellovibrionales bacterium]
MRRGWPLSIHFVVATLVASITLTTSCTKLSRNPASKSSSSTSNAVISNSGNFVLSTVLPSQQSAGTQYDMIGQGGEFDNYCGDAASPCLCEYTYDQGGVIQSASIAPTYQETNLLRCANQVPSGIPNFDVKIVTGDGSMYSNTITVNLSSGTFAGSTLYLDLTGADSYVQAKRFQCRKHEFIKNPLDQNMIDPIQSEDPKVNYAFNFYTTNVSESLLQMQRLANQDWECTLTETQDRSLHWWANANVYSSSPCTDSFCSGDGELMYPQTSLVSGKIPVSNPASVGKRRGSFWMAKQAYGVFQIPVQAALAPKDYVSSTYGVIGYAAKPIPSTAGSSSCPAIPLPAKSTWVKIWNFRATDITPPKKLTSSTSIASGDILCNPGAITAPTASSVFPTCSGPRTIGSTVTAFGSGLGSVVTTTDLASRIVILPTTGSGTLVPNACYNMALNFGATLADDLWTPSPIAFGDPGNGGLTIDQIKTLPWNVYLAQNATFNSTSFVKETAAGMTSLWRDDKNGALIAAVPQDSLIQTAVLSTDNYTDQIFVVTDANVDDTAMRNQAPSASQYKPVTYRTSNDCNGISRTACSTNRELHWDVNVKEVGNAASADMYPLCVLQFYD